MTSHLPFNKIPWKNKCNTGTELRDIVGESCGAVVLRDLHTEEVSMQIHTQPSVMMSGVPGGVQPLRT